MGSASSTPVGKKFASSAKGWSLLPRLHKRVLQDIERDGLRFEFRNEDDTLNHINSTNTRIMGRFICKNSRCSTERWTSKTIAMTIREYPGCEYNAKVFHQRCAECNSISRPEGVEESYVARVAWRLRKWNGVKVKSPPRTERQDDRPHQSHLCEGCKAGVCKIGKG